MNLYATLKDVKSALGISDTASDAELLRVLESQSRSADAYCGRHFYTAMGSRYIDVPDTYRVLLPEDCLSLTAVAADSEGDGTWDGTTWDTGDYWLEPHDVYPKTAFVPSDWGTESLATRDKYLKLTGTWGYGDGESATPWLALTPTATVATSGGTTITLSAATDDLDAGHTILIESEQCYVRAVSGTSVVVRRGVNGTTAAAHSTKAVSVAQYPAPVRDRVILGCCYAWRELRQPGVTTVRIGQYSETRADASTPGGSDPQSVLDARLLGPYRRWRLA